MLPLLRLLSRSQAIDRRILYLLLAVVVSLPFVVSVRVPPPLISPQTRQFYDTIERIAADPVQSRKLIIFCTNYAPGTLAENQPQTEAVMRHLMRKRLKFAIFAFNYPQGRDMGQRAVNALREKYDYHYGTDFVNWGFRPPDAIEPLLKAAVRDIPGALGNDINGTPLSEVPVMQGIQSVDDIAIIIEVASSQTLQNWLKYYQRTGTQPVPTLYCPTGVMAADAVPYLKSGQLQGMLMGLRGAIEYEALLQEPGFATRASASLSYAHFLIIALVALGNIGMFAAKHLNEGKR